MDVQTLTRLVKPFYPTPLTDQQVAQFAGYLDLLLKWNRKMNLTAIRQPDEIVSRHFGESLFAAGILMKTLPQVTTFLDLGSGAGFPGLPIKIALPSRPMVLAESQQKKAMFLREVVRTLALSDAEVFAGRAESIQRQFDVVGMRAVDDQENLFDIAEQLLVPDGSLLLMSGTEGVDAARAALPDFIWAEPIRIPNSTGRWVFIGKSQRANVS